jgi:nitrogen regulatory protein PII-like uncharacterized protein
MKIIQTNHDYLAAHYRMRNLIGVLGILLPFVLWFFEKDVLPSLSDYYYSSAGVFFIGVLAVFGIMLISYKGYAKKEDETVSDNILTNVAGFAVLVVVLVPTEFCSDILNIKPQLFSHTNQTLSIVHLGSAAVFLACMGGMSFFKFPRHATPESQLSTSDKNERLLFRTCGVIVWAALGMLFIYFLLFKFEVIKEIENMVYIGETIAVIPFGISWLVKGKGVREVSEAVSSMMKPKS